MVNAKMNADEVLAFWLQAGPAKWFTRDHAFDQAIRDGFEALHMRASRGELDDWAKTADGALALLILIDQFPRNLYRGSGHAFATDPLALATARQAIECGFDSQVEPQLRVFFYLPYEHSERIEDQDRSVALCERHRDATGDEDTLKWALLHREIIRRFGRFPHRNTCLGRITTAEEQAFLEDGGFAG